MLIVMVRDGVKRFSSVYLKGFAMGVADAIPGVSGGTIALILGIYERMINAITSVSLSKINEMFHKFIKLDFKGLNQSFKDLEFYFLLALATGILSAVILVLRGINYLLGAYPVWVYGFFFGLIGVSAVMLMGEIEFTSLRLVIIGFLGFGMSFIVSGYTATNLGNELPWIFLAGLLAVSAKILPGISGSLILIILGQYEYMTQVLSEFTDSILNFFVSGDFNLVLENFVPVFVFMTGSLFGLFTIAHFVKQLLEKDKLATMVFLTSMVLGSLRAPIAQLNEVLSVRGTTWFAILPEFIFTALMGVTIVLAIDYFVGIEY